ncbi:hypothetical protein VPNG_04664 [Cytospora leucostoma]|uniref:DUF7918 domain-containing protein n=1 Tax=Cytospora leucostoma TaxID=1230097 RepID=A0A423XAE3_9PEZI|nr:hypothetical protein VPNG_04664 [Cytospora leucostoma]
MAIIDNLGLEVKILVNGSAATEYVPDKEDQADGHNFGPSTKICCRYIQSIDDAHFAISAGLTWKHKVAEQWIKESQNNCCGFDFSVDGRRIDVLLISKRHEGAIILEGFHDRRSNTLREFRFASVSTVDDANRQVAEDMKTAKNLGLIRVLVWRSVIREKDILTNFPGNTSNLTDGGLSLAEKALKGRAISHGAAFSAPVAASQPRRHDVVYLSPPLAVFYFMYRSKEGLQQELIIPRPRSLSIKSEVDNLPPEELRRLARERLSQMRGDNKRAASVKEDKDAAPRSSRPYKYVKIEGGKEVIDLTEDD